MSTVNLRFHHGLGDCIHYAHALQLWRRRGYEVRVDPELNKRLVWQAAGIAPPVAYDPPAHGYGYPWQFGHLDQPIHLANKIAHNLEHDLLPPIGSREELWRELCGVRIEGSRIIGEAARREAAAFVADLPRPRVALHTRGTNWQERKSLPIETAFGLVTRLLDAGMSVISLDFDRREPIVGDARCRGLKPGWGHIDLDRLLALYELCDLMIGVDSGPFHATLLSGVRALGVFRQIHPVHCCLPNPNAVHLVSSDHRAAWLLHRDAWRFAEYNGTEPTAEAIADCAARILRGEPVEILADQVATELVGRYLYRRVRHDERVIELRADGTVGNGAGDCERTWSTDGSGHVISLSGSTPTCRCVRDQSGIWRGAWLRAEKMPVEITTWWPGPATTDRDGLERHGGVYVREGVLGARDREVVHEVLGMDAYRLRLRRMPTELRVIDVGAHIGTFSAAIRQRHPAPRIVCVEACPENWPVLHVNADAIATVLEGACWYGAEHVRLHNSVLAKSATGGSICVPLDHDQAPSEYYVDDHRSIPAWPLEDIASRAGFDLVDLLKLDCEGAEFNILTGGADWIDQHVAFITLEYHGLERWESLRLRSYAHWHYSHHHSAGGLGIAHLANPRFLDG